MLSFVTQSFLGRCPCASSDPAVREPQPEEPAFIGPNHRVLVYLSAPALSVLQHKGVVILGRIFYLFFGIGMAI